MRLIAERLISKFKFVLTYRTRSANETVSSQSCCSLVNFFHDLLLLVDVQQRVSWRQYEIYQIYQMSDEYNDVKFSIDEMFYVLVSQIFIYVSNIYTTQLNHFENTKRFSSIWYRRVYNFGNPCTSRCYHQK